MAISIYRNSDSDLLYNINDKQYDLLVGIFEDYRQRTGLLIDPYSDTRLSVENQQVLVAIIDKYVANADLNRDKNRTVAILELRAVLLFFIGKEYSLRLIGD